LDGALDKKLNKLPNVVWDNTKALLDAGFTRDEMLTVLAWIGGNDDVVEKVLFG